MTERIYAMDERENLEPLEERRFEQEEHLQALIADHPDLLAGEQIRPEDPRRWILITREQGIAETPDSASIWAVDHLLIDQDAIPTLVEVKRGESRRTRREVVGQMLDYAAHAPTTWAVDDIRRSFEESRDNADEVLDELLDSDGEPDVDGFWEQVRVNLVAKRIRLLFVADEIPDTLESVVTFLNEQMPNIEVLAVEIKRFSGETSRQMLVPRVLGRVPTSSSRGRSTSQRMTRQTFFDRFDDPGTRDAARRLLEVVDAVKGVGFNWGRNAVTIRARCPLWKNRISVAWLYPVSGQSHWLRDFTFGVQVPNDYPESLSRLLEGWANRFANDGFSHKHQAPDALAYYVKHEDVAANIDVLCDRLKKVLTGLKDLESPILRP